MKDSRVLLYYCCAALIGAALFYARAISAHFSVGTTTFDHPYVQFVGALLIAGVAWMGLIALIAKLAQSHNTRAILLASVVFGIGLRAMFLGSTPIYENDWNRYLWDGAVLTEGINPYNYTPLEVLEAPPDAHASVQHLNRLSAGNGDFADRINYGHLTTIYPPLPQAVFGLAALIKPFDLNALRFIFIVIDAFSMWLMVKTLSLYGRNSLWAVLYILNPLVIYVGFNAVHMEIILVPFLLLALFLIKSRPYWAACALACAAAVKLWPLLLAPIVFRSWRAQGGLYIRCALIVTGLFLLLTAPLLLALGDNSGLSAYAQTWQRSSFIFPLLSSGLAWLPVFEPDTVARLTIAALLTGLSLWLGFARTVRLTLPTSMMVMILALLLLSPTGYPWYAIWFLVFLPFVPSYGAALLSVSVALYYTRYALDEQGLNGLYETLLLPVQFGLPIIVMLAEYYKSQRRHV